MQQLIRDKIIDKYKLSDKDVVSTGMGQSGIDVQLSEAARKEFPFAVEAKSLARFSIYRLWEQCKTNASKEDLIPLLIIKADYKKPLAVIDLDDLLTILPIGEPNDE